MSMWEGVTKPYHPLPKWAHWPKPFNVIKNINVLACNNDSWMAEIEFYAQFFGEMFWHITVPTPTELTRKTFFGRYRCGLGLDIIKWDPMSVVWGEATTRIVAEIFRPFVTPIFYWWAADTLWYSMNSWQSLIYAQAQCDIDPNEVLIADGFAAVASGTTNGSIPFWQTIHDPLGRANLNSGFIDAMDGDNMVYAYIRVENGKSVPITIGWWLAGTDRDQSNMVVVTIPSGGVRNIRISGTPISDPETYQPRFNNQLGEWNPLGFIRYTGVRFGVARATAQPFGDDYDDSGQPKSAPTPPCFNQYLKPTTAEAMS